MRSAAIINFPTKKVFCLCKTYSNYQRKAIMRLYQDYLIFLKLNQLSFEPALIQLLIFVLANSWILFSLFLHDSVPSFSIGFWFSLLAHILLDLLLPFLFNFAFLAFRSMPFFFSYSVITSHQNFYSLLKKLD